MSLSTHLSSLSEIVDMTHIFFHMFIFHGVFSAHHISITWRTSMVIATSNVLFGNGLVCNATHVVGDCLFECNGKSWSITSPMTSEEVFSNITDRGEFDECVDILDGFVRDCYCDYMCYNNI